MDKKKALENLELILNRIKEFHPSRIILFGSAANEYVSEINDIDLLVVFPSLLKKRGRTVEILSRLRDLSVPIDVVVTTEESLEKNKEKSYTIENQANRSGKAVYVAQ